MQTQAPGRLFPNRSTRIRQLSRQHDSHDANITIAPPALIISKAGPTRNQSTATAPAMPTHSFNAAKNAAVLKRRLRTARKWIFRMIVFTALAAILLPASLSLWAQGLLIALFPALAIIARRRRVIDKRLPARSDLQKATAASFTYSERNEFRLARWRRRYQAYLNARANNRKIRFPLEFVRAA